MKTKRQQISVIIPAYNEEMGIAGVLKPIIKNKLIGEIIVVDDGSTDNTEKIIRSIKSEKITFIKHKKNKGKAGAMLTGIKKATNDYVLFLDADLVGIKDEDILKMVLPVIEKKVDITFSMRSNSYIYMPFGIDFVTGERCATKKFFVEFFKRSIKGYGAEVLMNKLILQKRMKFVSIWVSYRILNKTEKIGFVNGVWSEVGMVLEIFKNYSFFGVVFQLIKMSFLQRKYNKLI